MFQSSSGSDAQIKIEAPDIASSQTTSFLTRLPCQQLLTSSCKMLMTRQVLLDICKEHKLYRTPSLNDKLYCNFKGFTNIANLEEYTDLRALFLEGNALDHLEGLDTLKELRCLYVQQNCLTSISGLEHLKNLDTLNISYNSLRRLENLSCCPNLRTLICTNNQLSTVESILHLAECKSLHTVDLQNNIIADPAVIDVLKQIPELKCVYLKGNPVVSNIKNYRKALIAALPELTYLDDRPVFPDERRLVQAWKQGGMDAEREERRKIRAEEEERNNRNFELMQAIRKEGWRKRRDRLGLAPGDTDPALDDLSDNEYVFEEEPAELVEARQRLAAYTARQGEEEPPELSQARATRAGTGAAIQERAEASHGASEDGQIYLDSMRQRQADLASCPGNAADGNNLGTRLSDGQPDVRGVPDAGTKRIAVVDVAASKTAAARREAAESSGVNQHDDMPALELVSDIDLTDLD